MMQRAIQVAVLAALAVVVAGGARALAQGQFQAAYGGAQNDAARGGVIVANDGGYIAVGETRSFPGGVNPNYNVYAVKTDECGRTQWANAYDIGGDDFGRRIQSVPTGGYIIAGSTQNAAACSPNDIFLLKIRDDGTVEWARTYGGLDVDEAWDVRVVPSVAIEPDYLVAGGTRSFNAGTNGVSMDAFLMKTNNVGVPVWGRVYGTKYDEYFRTCLVTANGQFVAAGAIQVSGAPQNDTDVFVVRTDASGNLAWANRYGVATGREDAWRLVELSAQDGNNLVFAGHTTSAGNSGDGLAMVLTPAGAFVAARAFGSAGWDEFRDIQIDASIASLMVIAGYFDNSANGRAKDVFVCEILPALQFGPRMLYGGVQDDLGWGVVSVVEGDHTESVVAGVTSNFGAGLEDLYMLKVNQDMIDSNCNDQQPTVLSPTLTFQRVGLSFCGSNIQVTCKSAVAVYRAVGEREICPCEQPAAPRIKQGLSLRGGRGAPASARLPTAALDMPSAAMPTGIERR